MGDLVAVRVIGFGPTASSLGDVPDDGLGGTESDGSLVDVETLLSMSNLSAGACTRGRGLHPGRGCVKGGVHFHVAVAVKVHDHDHDDDHHDDRGSTAVFTDLTTDRKNRALDRDSL